MDFNVFIENIQNDLGTSYLAVGEYFQILKSEVENAIFESEKAVRDFKSSIDSGRNDSLKNLVLQSEQIISEAEKRYSSYSSNFKAIYNQIKSSFDIINNMNTPIARIIDSAELMELFALNSMVVAIQAGKDGGGFTYISEELQKNARTIFSHAHEINNRRNSVINSYELFTESTDRLLSNQKNLESLLKTAVDNEFPLIKQNLSKCIDFFEKINVQAAKMHPLLMKIMEGLQNQDIIRQSLDHVRLSLDEIEKASSEIENNDEIVVIKKKLYELCIYVIDEVSERLEADFNLLKDNTFQIEEYLEKLENEKKHFHEYHIANNESNNDSLMSSINAITSSFHEIFKVLGNNHAHETSMLKEKESLYFSFLNLNEANLKFEAPLNLFKNIIIMAKIEIARQRVIQNVEISIANIYTEINKILESVNKIEKINTDVINANTIADRDISALLAGTKDFLHLFKNEIEKFLELYKISADIIISIIENLKFLNNNFTNCFNNLGREVSVIKSTLKELQLLKENLEVSYNRIKKEYYSISSTEIEQILENSRIKNLLNKFTIFRHKGKLIDIEDDSAQDSSITLF